MPIAQGRRDFAIEKSDSSQYVTAMSIVSESFAQIDRQKAQLDELRPLPSEIEERVMQKFRLWWTYHSNAIEGNKLTQGETEMFLMEGLTAKGKPLKDHLDLQGHSNAINYLLAFIRNKETLTEASIRKLHEVLLVESYKVPAVTPDGLPTSKTVSLGQYKTQPNHVRTPTGELHYYAAPEDTSPKMHALMTWQREELENGVIHPVEVAARFHHEFTAIHPFDDGNGRMARLLMNLLLMQKGYPPVVIRISERDEYLMLLREADRREPDDFLCFIAEHVIASLSLYSRAAIGEEIHEPSDLEKEVALLKLQVQHIEEPETLTREHLLHLSERSLRPLFAEIKRLLLPLCELFSENALKVVRVYGSMGFLSDERLDLSASSELPELDYDLQGGNVIKELSWAFQLNGFKKAGLEAFDASAAVTFGFERLKYSVQLSSDQVKSAAHFYQEQLTRDEVTGIAQKLARQIFETVQQKVRARS